MMTAARRTTLALSTAALVTVGLFAQRAEAIYCSNCSTTWQQASQLVQEIKTAVTEVQSHITQLMQYANMIQNTIQLPMALWTQVQSEIMSVRGLANIGSLTGGSISGIISRLNSAGYMISNLAMMPTTWRMTIGNDLNSLRQQFGLQQAQTATDASLITQLQQASSTSMGRMQAILAGNQINGATASEVFQVNQTLTGMGQLQATQAAIAADQQAAYAQFTTPMPVALGGYKTW